jgi:hypothetical protein
VTPTGYERMRQDADPVVSAVANARAAAVKEGDMATAKDLEHMLDGMDDPARDLLRVCKRVIREIDEIRYDYGHTLGGMVNRSKSQVTVAENLDEWLAHVASRIVGGVQSYEQERESRR